ncbi:GntR family transcriptional regulator [Caldimonas tepidiphila]|uniref:GntR family transcriptional regulator n=1 Tax=Caldimonas tepidiphila TaxID=2315841 RepID=UPI000E5A2A8A|nr:GntR family transcriptional regulator [Caldimonas tepidiphila]
MSQQTATLIRLREMILRGELAPGERVTEASLAARLGISRTPVRNALPALAQEGLLVRAGQRGFAVKEFDSRESLEALRLRAVLEGVAARALAERGASPDLLEQLGNCLREGDQIFMSRSIDELAEARYGEMNSRFHGLILHGAQRPLLADLVARCNVVAFTSPKGVAFSEASKRSAFDLLFYAHQQHHAIVDAIAARQGDRAEFLFREHAITQEQSMSMDLAAKQG